MDSTTKSLDRLSKELAEGFKAANANLTDLCKSVRKLSESVAVKDDNYWHPTFGQNGEVPGEEYDWVLVKIREKGSVKEDFGVPHIAEFRNGRWWAQEIDEPYESELWPFEVRFWRPIPGDCCHVLYAGGAVVDRRHSYEN